MTTRIERLKVGPIGENVYAVQSGTAAFLVDPGDEPEAILSFLDACQIRPLFIVLTHGHLDHCAAIPELLAFWKDTPPKVAIHSLDAQYLGIHSEQTNRLLFDAIRAPSFFQSYWKQLPEPDLLLAEGDQVPGTDFTVIHTPGHSAGSICLYSAKDAILISGDCLFRDGVGRTDGPDSDYTALSASLRRLALLDLDTVVYPGHGPRTSIGRELSHVVAHPSDRTAFER